MEHDLLKITLNRVDLPAQFLSRDMRNIKQRILVFKALNEVLVILHRAAHNLVVHCFQRAERPLEQAELPLQIVVPDLDVVLELHVHLLAHQLAFALHQSHLAFLLLETLVQHEDLE